MKKLRIFFIWDWEPEYSQAVTWQDGLAAAMRILGERHEVGMYTVGKQNTIQHPYFDLHVSDDIMRDARAFKPDVILHWADMTRPHARELASLGVPMALCFAGGETITSNTRYFQHVFAESQVYKQVFERNAVETSIAFGTNTELFKPLKQTKTFDTIFPATFALWKRHELYAQATKGLRSLACGYMYTTHEQECWQVCLDNGVTILPHTSHHVLQYLYAASRVCVIPSLSGGGSQRTVLEAMAMNLPLVVCDSDKFDYVEGQDVKRVAPAVQDIRQAVEDSLDKEVDTRQYILDNWSEYCYADAIEKGLASICA